MKKIITLGLITLTLVLTSCDNTPIRVPNPDKVTTVELQNIAKADTNVYKVVIVSDPSGTETMYIINPKIDKVEMKLNNDSGFNTTLEIILSVFVLFSFVSVIILFTRD